jgi:hypothetical protein
MDNAALDKGQYQNTKAVNISFLASSTERWRVNVLCLPIHRALENI